jgi:hypothetical protein
LPEQHSDDAPHICSGALHSPTGTVQIPLAHLPEQQSLFATQALAGSLHVATDVMQIPLPHQPPQQLRWLVHAKPAPVQATRGGFTHFAASHLPEQHSPLPPQPASMALQRPAGCTQMPPLQLPEQHCQSARQAFAVAVHTPAGAVQSSLLQEPEQQSPSATHAVLRRCFEQTAAAASSAPSAPASAAGAGVSLFGVAGVAGVASLVGVPSPEPACPDVSGPGTEKSSLEQPPATAVTARASVTDKRGNALRRKPMVLLIEGVETALVACDRATVE